MNIKLLAQTSQPEDLEETISLMEKWLADLWEWFLDFLPNLVASILVLVLGLWLSKVICKIVIKAMNKSKADITVTSFLKSILNIVLKILVLVSAASTLGFDMTGIITALGAATVAIGLALKDSLSNVASGVLIIINKKFKVGDYLETEGLKGKVTKIEMMHTVLQTYDNKEITIPNSRLMSNNITNYFVLEERRVDISVGIGYNDDIDKAKKIAWNIIHGQKNVLQERSNDVVVDKLGDSSVVLAVKAWCKSEDYWDVLAEMNEKIKKEFDANNISIPYNQIDIHIQNPDKDGAKS